MFKPLRQVGHADRELIRRSAALPPTWLDPGLSAVTRSANKAQARPLEVRLTGQRFTVWLVFAGNGTYAPKGFGAAHRPALDTGLLLTWNCSTATGGLPPTVRSARSGTGSAPARAR